MTTKVRLKEATFTRGNKPIRTLMWCDRVPKGKRCKPAKINGIQHHEISNAVGDDFVAIEHVYYQPL